MEAHNVLDVLTAALNRRPPTPTAEEAVFAEVRLKMPVDSNAGTVSVHLGKETSTLTLEGPLTSPTRETFTIPHAEGVPDTEAMASRIRPFKTSHPGTDRVRVSADATIRYSDVVTVIGVLGNRLFLSAELMVGPRNALL